MIRKLATLTLGVAAVVLGGAPAAASPVCPPDPPRRKPVPAVARLELSPAHARLHGKGAEERVFVTAVLASGARKDVSGAVKLQALGPQVRVAERSTLAAVRDGSTKVRISYGGKSTLLPVTVSRAAEAVPVSFLYDVLPIVSRAGCNQGTCHGNAEGRGGLKLSFKGEDPAGDHAVLAVHGGGRRVNRADPGRSLLLLKATSALPHGGGPRLSVGSEEYRTLAHWIAQGAQLDPPGAPRLQRLVVSPRERVLVQPAGMQRLTVTGYFSDGSVRNLAHRAVYSSGDPALQLSADGLVGASGSGDAAVLVRYADQMENARLTFVPARPGFRWKPVPASNWIDEVHFARLKQLRLEPSRLTTDAEFVRRAYLDAAGRLPPPDEAREFLVDRSPQKRERLIDRLVDSAAFDDYWTLKWSDVLRVEERSLDPKGAQAYRDWIREWIASDRPLDQFARELLTATGSTYTTPPANYFRRTRSATDLGETTAQIFMGTRMLCAKCHNHPTERWKQDDYYTLAAFFSRIGRKGELTRRDQFDLHELKGEEFISVTGAGEVKHPRTGQVMPPGLPGLVLAADAPEPVRRDPRVAFAEWLTRPGNPYFARNLANRIWYHLTGRGIVDPVDDLRESNPPSNPALLDGLAKELVSHGFRMKPLVRTIMKSRTYQLACEPNATNADDERFFSRGIPGRLTAEVLLDAISDLTGAPERFRGYPAGMRAVQYPPQPPRQQNPFLKLFGQPARESVCECERTGETTLGQSFALISGESIDEKLRRPENRVGKLLEAGKADAEIVTELYLAAYSRFPSAAEQAKAAEYVASKPERRAALEDLTWALLNSKEFLLRR
ncbi:MAG: DUF1549 and DUF1553 domain-containing protein [Armatimonadota bacterium]